jgi:DNA-binding MarR family transcriptional regulator
VSAASVTATLPARHDEYTRKILDAIETGHPVSQRSLSRELGVALGLTNLLIRRLVKRGFVRVLNVKPNRVRYLITPAGIAEKTRVTRAFLENTVRLYTQTRDQILENLVELSVAWPREDVAKGGSITERSDNGQKRIVFYGAGEVAEIAFVCLQNTDLHLVGIVDDHVRTPFFKFPVQRPEDLQSGYLNGEPFSRVVIMSFRKAEQMRLNLRRLGLPDYQVAVLKPSMRRPSQS